MDAVSRSPLSQSREDALTFLSRMIAWGFAPVAASVLLYRWYAGQSAEVARAAFVIAVPLSASLAVSWLLRPAPARPHRVRGNVAIVLMAALASWGLVFNGPRAANAIAMAIVLALSVLFVDSRRTFLVIVSALVAVGLAGWGLRAAGVLSPPLPSTRFFGVDEVATDVLMLMGLGYTTYLLWATMEHYRRSQVDLQIRTEELIASRAAAQQLLRQEMLARLATTIAGEVAGQLDAVSAHTGDAPLRLREAGARASHTLRLLESLGQPAAHDDEGADIHRVLQGVEQTLRPVMPEGHVLDIVDAAATRPLMDAAKLEHLIVYLALRLKEQMHDGRGVVIRVYEGLGDVSRADGRRTWTIIDVGRLLERDGSPDRQALAAPDADASAEAIDLALANVGARLEREVRDEAVYYVLQLPSR